MLHGLTVTINFIALMVALWCGLYLLTHSSRRPETWLVALAIGSSGGFFLNQLLALYPPPAPTSEIRAWLYHVILFWPRDVFEMGWKGWLFGWLPSYSISFWYHATLYMLPGPFTRRRWWLALLGYAVVLTGILVKARYTNTWANLLKDPLDNSFMNWPYSPWFVIGLLALAGLSAFNLVRAARSSTNFIFKAQFWLFMSAIGLVATSGLLGMVFSLIKISIPQALIALFWLAAILLAGAGMASRTARLDFHQKIHLRLKDLISQGESQDCSETLGIFLETLAKTMKAAWSAVLSENSHGMTLRAAWNLEDARSREVVSALQIRHLPADGIIALKPQQLSPVLDQAVAAVPLTNAGHRSLLLVGAPPGRSGFSKIELGVLEDTGIFLTDVMQEHCPDKEPVESFVDFSSPQESEPSSQVRGISFRTVELALRNFHNYAYLADSPLSQFRLITQRVKRLETEGNTYLNRGREVSIVLSEVVCQLRPSQEDIPIPPSRNWYPYLVLWEAYVENKPNREIMSRLYISEGTFNRTRKAAISTVARLLMEMEERSG